MRERFFSAKSRMGGLELAGELSKVRTGTRLFGEVPAKPVGPRLIVDLYEHYKQSKTPEAATKSLWTQDKPVTAWKEQGPMLLSILKDEHRRVAGGATNQARGLNGYKPYFLTPRGSNQCQIRSYPRPQDPRGAANPSPEAQLRGQREPKLRRLFRQDWRRDRRQSEDSACPTNTPCELVPP